MFNKIYNNITDRYDSPQSYLKGALKNYKLNHPFFYYAAVSALSYGTAHLFKGSFVDLQIPLIPYLKVSTLLGAAMWTTFMTPSNKFFHHELYLSTSLCTGVAMIALLNASSLISTACAKSLIIVPKILLKASFFSAAVYGAHKFLDDHINPKVYGIIDSI